MSAALLLGVGAAALGACVKPLSVHRLASTALVGGASGGLLEIARERRSSSTWRGRCVTAALRRVFVRDIPEFASRAPLSILGLAVTGLGDRSYRFVLGLFPRQRDGSLDIRGRVGPAFRGILHRVSLRIGLVVRSLDLDLRSKFLKELRQRPVPAEVRSGVRFPRHRALADATAFFSCPPGYHRSARLSVEIRPPQQLGFPPRSGRMVFFFPAVPRCPGACPGPGDGRPTAVATRPAVIPFERLRLVDDDLRWVDGSPYRAHSYLVVEIGRSGSCARPTRNHVGPGGLVEHTATDRSAPTDPRKRNQQ